MSDDGFDRKQRERVLAHWKAQRWPATHTTPPAPPEPDLATLQREAEARAVAFWDEDEAADIAKDRFSPIDIGAALDAVVLKRAPYLGGHQGEAYRLYLQSEHWQRFRSHMLVRADGYCDRCNQRRRRLEVHHLNYEWLGRERAIDVIVLCHECHEAEHGRTW